MYPAAPTLRCALLALLLGLARLHAVEEPSATAASQPLTQPAYPSPARAASTLTESTRVGPDAVVVLHGLGLNRFAMTRLACSLRRDGYRVINVSYPSRSLPFEQLAADWLPAMLRAQNADTAPRLHFVTHSMGGILLRLYLRDHAPENLGRIVMLAPPNHGSEVAEKLRNNPAFHLFTGKNGRRLGTSPESLPGWPEETLQLLIVAVVTERLRPENADGTHAEPLNYWDEQLESNAFPELRRKNLLAQKQEKVAILKGLLGEAYQPPEAEELFFQGLPRGKVTAVATIKADYATMRNELVAQEGAGKSASSDQYALLTREERADIARTLSPDEFFEYELRNSVTASELRYNTSAFEPTEAEFRALFSIKNPLDEPAFNLDTIAAGKLRKDTEAQLDAQARTLLSEERFKQFVRSRDAEYRRYYALGKYLQLPAATANTAYEIKADIDQRARALEAASPTDNERRALAQEAESRLTATFGAKGMEIYKLNSRYLYLLTIPPSARPGGR